MTRIVGAVTAAVMAVLIGLTWMGYEPQVVIPTGGVVGGGPQDNLPASREADQVLQARTELQRWRAAGGPSPAEQADPTITGQAIEGEGAALSGSELVSQWLDRRDVDQNILRDREFVEGIVSIPDEKAAVLQQPAGRDFRRLQNEEITYGGDYLILGTVLILALFLAIRGRVRIADGFSGRKILRFAAHERANHWMTATCFILVALTGLILLYGQYLLKPLFGANLYADIATGSAYLHIAFALPLVIGVAIMIVLWLRQNMITGVDLHWLRKAGGMLHDSPDKPSAYRFNAGQKLIFWGVVLGTLALLVSGLSLVFPFFWLDIHGMQLVLIGHAVIGLLMVAMIIGHIYIGTIGMEGAFDAMWSGDVDWKWAKEHHDLWVEGKGPGGKKEINLKPADDRPRSGAATATGR